MSDKHGASIISMLEQSKSFTEDLIQENRFLRAELGKLRAQEQSRGHADEVAHLRSLVASLESELATTRDELEELRENLEGMQQENSSFAQQYVRIEQQNSQLASMYVASYRLHTTLDFNELVDIIKEVVINLIGSERFAVYAWEDKSEGLLLVGHECEGELPFPQRVATGEGPIGVAIAEGQRQVAEPEVVRVADGEQPIAVIPLRLDETIVGAIAIYQLLSQKDGFAAVDFELFDLLASHAAAAMFSAQVYSRSKRKLDTLQGLLELVRPTS